MPLPSVSKTLRGDINLVGGFEYNFSLPTVSGTALPNANDNSVLEEVYIKCDVTLGPITINLPAISTFNLAWNTKVYISCVGGIPGEANSLIVYSYAGSETTLADTINGNYGISFSALNETNYLHIVDKNLWMCLNAPGFNPVL
jgi:hypothetical protein